MGNTVVFFVVRLRGGDSHPTVGRLPLALACNVIGASATTSRLKGLDMTKESAKTTGRSRTFTCFVIMKFGSFFDDIYTKGIAPISRLPFGSDRVRLRRADVNRKGLNFLHNVWSNVQACDFVLADISPYDEPTSTGRRTIVPYNPNVFYEIGYAKALNKPVVVISHGDRGRPPVDLTDCIVQ